MESLLVTKQLWLWAFTAVAWVQSLVWELRFPQMVQPKKKKKKSYVIVTYLGAIHPRLGWVQPTQHCYLDFKMGELLVQ